MKDVTPLLTQIPPQTNIPTADQVQELTQLVATLPQTAAADQSTVATLLTAMSYDQTQLQADFAALKTALASALPLEA